MNHIGVDGVAQGYAGNQVAGQAVLPHDLGPEVLGVRTTLHDLPFESLRLRLLALGDSSYIKNNCYKGQAKSAS